MVVRRQTLIVKAGTASFYPEPANKEAFVRAQLYNTDYSHVRSRSIQLVSYSCRNTSYD